jgi:hypothetical protein
MRRRSPVRYLLDTNHASASMESENEFKDRYVFEPAVLPPGFRFPEAYLQIMGAAELPKLTPWWFLGKRRRSADFWLHTLREQYPSRLLIPFAKRDDLGDTIAAFDASDTSGNPKVFHIHAFTEPGWEQRGTWESFDEWLKQAQADSAEFRADDD